jgi:hypothetical protein
MADEKTVEDKGFVWVKHSKVSHSLSAVLGCVAEHMQIINDYRNGVDDPMKAQVDQF